MQLHQPNDANMPADAPATVSQALIPPSGGEGGVGFASAVVISFSVSIGLITSSDVWCGESRGTAMFSMGVE